MNEWMNEYHSFPPEFGFPSVALLSNHRSSEGVLSWLLYSPLGYSYSCVSVSILVPDVLTGPWRRDEYPVPKSFGWEPKEKDAI